MQGEKEEESFPRIEHGNKEKLGKDFQRMVQAKILPGAEKQKSILDERMDEVNWSRSAVKFRLTDSQKEEFLFHIKLRIISILEKSNPNLPHYNTSISIEQLLQELSSWTRKLQRENQLLQKDRNFSHKKIEVTLKELQWTNLTLKSDLGVRENNVLRLKERIEDLNEELGKIRNTLSMKDKEITELNELIFRKDKALEHEKAAYKDLQVALIREKADKKEKDLIQADSKSLRQQVNQLLTFKQTVEKIVEELRAEIGELMGNLEAEEGKNEVLGKKLRGSQERIEKLEKELEARKEELRVEGLELRKEKMRLRILEESVAKYRKEIEDVAELEERDKGQMDQLRLENKHLKEWINLLEKKQTDQKIERLKLLELFPHFPGYIGSNGSFKSSFSEQEASFQSQLSTLTQNWKSKLLSTINEYEDEIQKLQSQINPELQVESKP